MMGVSRLQDQVLRDKAKKYPLVAARRYFRMVRPGMDLHTAYTQALAYYTSLTGEKPFSWVVKATQGETT